MAMAKAGVNELVQKGMAADNASAKTQEWGQKLMDQLP